jgi:hypothetical protein
MTRTAKVLTIVALSILAIPVGATLLVAGSVVAHGVVTVNVQESKQGGTHLYLPVPADLLYLGMDLLPVLDQHDDLARTRREIGPWAPVALAAMQSIEDCPDAVLVDVESHGQTVKIVKVGRSIEIDVHDQGDDVHISLPAHLFTRALRQLA